MPFPEVEVGKTSIFQATSHRDTSQQRVDKDSGNYKNEVKFLR